MSLWVYVVLEIGVGCLLGRVLFFLYLIHFAKFMLVFYRDDNGQEKYRSMHFRPGNDDDLREIIEFKKLHGCDDPICNRLLTLLSN